MNNPGFQYDPNKMGAINQMPQGGDQATTGILAWLPKLNYNAILDLGNTAPFGFLNKMYNVVGPRRLNPRSIRASLLVAFGFQKAQMQPLIMQEVHQHVGNLKPMGTPNMAPQQGGMEIG